MSKLINMKARGLCNISVKDIDSALLPISVSLRLKMLLFLICLVKEIEHLVKYWSCIVKVFSWIVNQKRFQSNVFLTQDEKESCCQSGNRFKDIRPEETIIKEKERLNGYDS